MIPDEKQEKKATLKLPFNLQVEVTANIWREWGVGIMLLSGGPFYSQWLGLHLHLLTLHLTIGVFEGDE